MEIWLDTLYGVTSKLPFESNATYRKEEYFMQLGMEYFLDEKWSLVENVEGLYVHDRQHTYSSFVENGVTYYPTSQQNEKSGALYKILTYKIETAVKYKINKAAQITVGALFEKKQTERNGVKNLSFVRDVRNANDEAYKLASSISFWF